VIQKLKNLVHSIWVYAKLEIYGSHATNLALPSSDLDIVINIPSGPFEGDPLYFLGGLIEKEEWVDKNSIHCIETTSVPVIKLKTGQNLSLDITFYNSNHSGKKSRELISAYIQKYPQLKPMALFLKELLAQNSLNNPFKGGLGSYCLVIMIISFLQNYGLVTENLGELVLHFLEFYGILFHYDKMLISIDGYSNIDEYAPVPLLISDPLTHGNIGLSTFEMYKVKELFANTYNQLKKDNNFIQNLTENITRERHMNI